LTLNFIAAEQTVAGGLLFYSDYDADNLTQLDLTPTKPIPIKGKFTLSFDFYIWNTRPFGYLVNGYDNRQSVFVFSFVDYRNPDTSFFELTVYNHPGQVRIGVPNTELRRNRWHHAELNFDMEKQQATLTLDDQQVRLSLTDFPSTLNLQLKFGGVALGGDTPNMAIRDIELRGVSGKLIRGWPLNETEGNLAHEELNHEPARVSDGSWLINHHFKWQKVYSSICSDFQYPLYQTYSNTLFIWETNRLRKIDCETWKDTTIHLNQPLPPRFEVVQNSSDGSLMAFHGGGNGPVAEWDEEQLKWLVKDSLTTSEQYHGGGNFVDPRNGSLYRIGGYGYYTMKNHVQRYDPETGKWMVLPVHMLNNELFYPRQPVRVTAGKQPGEVFIFGGHGNKSGEQKRLFHWLNDLWVLNLDSLTLEKQWDAGDWVPEARMVSAEIIPQRDKIYYAYIEGAEENNVVELFTTGLDQPNFHQVGDGFVTGDILKGAFNLFYLENTNELAMLLVKPLEKNRSVQLAVYTLSLPVFSPSEFLAAAYLDTSRSKAGIFSILILVVLLIGGTWFTMKMIRKSDAPIPKQEQENVPSQLSPVSEPEAKTLLPVLTNGVTIKVFDDFCLWVDGEEIPRQAWGSKKARSLFLYILLKNSHGITLSEITLTFWPDVSRESALNSRAVALSKIRSVLGKHANLLERKNGRIFIAPGDTLSVDYYHLIFYQPNTHDAEVCKAEQILDLYGDGTLLPGLGEDWLDPIRHSAQEKALNLARYCANHYRKENEWDKLYNIGKRILQWNALNDIGLRYQVQALMKKNNPALAHQVFNEFRDYYFKEIEEPYKGAFESLLV
jgi:DNA-binding SARP family transcriptional activator